MDIKTDAAKGILNGHTEKHFTGSKTVRDIVIGMSDGLTVPFALAAGLSGVVDTTHLIVMAGLAEIAAGSIAMGLGGFLAAKSDAEHYDSEKKREEMEVIEKTDCEIAEIYDIFNEYGVTEAESKPIVEALQRQPNKWVDFMMKFELGLEEPEPKRARQSAWTIAMSYIAGGFIPLAPYIFIHSASNALLISVICTLIALGVFGYVKGLFTSTKPLKSSFQTVLIGGLAAGAAFLLARLFS